MELDLVELTRRLIKQWGFGVRVQELRELAPDYELDDSEAIRVKLNIKDIVTRL